jgi:rSAM/selenodomain-associated transferase 2
MSSTQPFLSIIVPVLNEAAIVRGFLLHLRENVPDAEIIVVDGGSADQTVPLCRGLADRVLLASRGRASQMNAGAAIARGEVLWFLHADSRLPLHATARIEKVLVRSNIVGGCFRLRFPSAKLIYRVSDSLGNIGVEIFGFALGDHGIFCRRKAFERVGGYPDVPLLEDAEIYRRLRKCGRMRQLRAEIQTSPRTYEAHGPLYTTAFYFFLLVLYVVGVPIPFLHRMYQSFMRPAQPMESSVKVAPASTA